jgi:hypothetical protein
MARALTAFSALSIIAGRANGMEIRKTFREVNPELLFAEVRDFAMKYGATPGDSKTETYSQPEDSTSFITRATLILKTRDEATKTDRECCRVHVVGSARGETKLMLDIDDRLFPSGKIQSLQADLDFVFKGYEIEATR